MRLLFSVLRCCRSATVAERQALSLVAERVLRGRRTHVAGNRNHSAGTEVEFLLPPLHVECYTEAE